MEDRTFRGHASTLGGGGLFLEGADLPEDADLTVQFRPAKHLPIVEAKAKVCYRLPGEGCGLSFSEIQPEHREVILRLIHHKTGDRRKIPRVAHATQIYCRDLMTISFSRDLSLGGMFIESRDPLPAGTRVELRFHLAEGDPVVVALGRIRYAVRKMGMGVEFIDMETNDRERIAAFVHAAQPLAGSPAGAETPS